MFAPFTKMHGCGNDFVVLDDRAGQLGITAARAAAIADRHTGIGCDQLIVLERPANGAAAFMRIRNPDGGEAGACGNATRCVAALLANQAGDRDVLVETVAGALPAHVLDSGAVSVDMGTPRLGWADIPLARPADTLHLPLPGDPAGLSMGNPHATWFVDDLARLDITTLGEARERDALFPERANIGFAQLIGPDRLRLRVWERGAGLTRACGSGACAAAVNAIRRGLTGRRVEVVADGGSLEIEWRDDGHVLMTGPVATAFTGTIDLASLPA